MRIAAALPAILFAACSAPMGTSVRKTPPKPFIEPQLGTYRPEPSAPPLALKRPLRIMILFFKDKREIRFPSVDRIWSRDAEGLGRRAEPREIRGFIKQGLVFGLERWGDIRVVDAKPDIVISGEIKKSQVSATFTKYRGTTELDVDLRDGNGRILNREPFRIKGIHVKNIFDKPSDWRDTSPLPPNPLAPTVEKSIEDALSRLLKNPAFREILAQTADSPL